jgi:hypothetical protein
MPTNREEASEIFKRLSLIEATLARIDERTASFVEDKKAVCACIENNTSRIAAIELRNAKVSGIVVAAGAVISVISTGISYLVSSVSFGNGGK